jgi:hypothetical protein
VDKVVVVVVGQKESYPFQAKLNKFKGQMGGHIICGKARQVGWHMIHIIPS